MITNMMKISLFVLAGMIMISGGSASDDDWCRTFDNKEKKCRQHPDQCEWKPAKGTKPGKGHCVFRKGIKSWI